MSRCWVNDGHCPEDADTEMFAPDGKSVGMCCFRHALAAQIEYREKLDQEWTIKREVRE